MELHELEVGHARAGPPRGRKSVTGGDGGIGGDAVDLPRPARREHDRVRPEDLLRARRRVEHERADAPVALREQVDEEALLEDRDALARAKRVGKRALDRGAGRVTRVQHARQASARPREPVRSRHPPHGRSARHSSRSSASASGASPTTARTTSSSHRPWPTTSVSARCSSTQSASPTAPAMPPCAYHVFVSVSRPLVTSATRRVLRCGERRGQAGDAAADDQHVALVSHAGVGVELEQKPARKRSRDYPRPREPRQLAASGPRFRDAILQGVSQLRPSARPRAGRARGRSRRRSPLRALGRDSP